MCILKLLVAFVVNYKINHRLCSLDKISDMKVVSTLSLRGVREAVLQTGRQVKNMGDKKRNSIMVLPSGEIKKVLSEGNIRYE